MGKRCDICYRKATKGASRSHSKTKTLKRQNINLQSRKVSGIALKICTSCLRTLAKKDAEIQAKAETKK
ncbi:MAG: 50S ribosomal protein L28 [Candidatus Pacebacteria bacterium]|nr:50S ribosomal protein L28 [Candidatus Paceibacterota bacterium]